MKTIALCVSAAVVSAAACGRDISVESTDFPNGTVSLSFGDADGFGSGGLYISYGAAPGGATTNGWDHTEKLADIAESDSSYVAAIPEGFGSSYSALRFFLFTRRQAGSGDYEADGLYAQWDGIDNAGSGSHSDASATWANLADPGITVGYSLGGEAQFTENAFRSVSQNSYFQLANAASWWQGIGDNSTWEAYVTPGKGWTTERSSAAGIMGAHWTPGCNGVVFGQIGRGAGNSINFCVCKSQEGGVGSIDLPFSAVGEGVAMHIAYVVTPTSSSVYTNGALFASVVAQMPLPLGEATFNIGAAFASADRGFEGDIHAIRVYSRALGADEIATNRDIDEMRFASNGDGMVETVSHSGTIVDSQVPVIEYAGRVETFSRKVSIPVGVVSFGSGANRCDLYADYGVSAQALTKTRLLAEGLAEDSVDAVIAGLEPETTYYARVYAKNASGESAALETISFTTAPEPPETYGSGRTISVVATNITAGAVTVTLELGDPGEDTAEYGLFAAWGGTPGG
ncbi:MAG: hypothetical protein ILO34_00615, partial [Kiritimatiellae bacterium]|nr:hypothetical protein [Kiritimatiellia bacterium]